MGLPLPIHGRGASINPAGRFEPIDFAVDGDSVGRLINRRFTAVPEGTMSSAEERELCSRLRSVLQPLPVQGSFRDHADVRAVLSALEYFIPSVFAEVYADWQRESLDGLFPIVARKVGDKEAELYGLCILISDQTTTPFRVRLRLAADEDKVAWCECRVGERSDTGMVRLKWNRDALPKRLHALEGREAQIEWVYRAGFGEEVR